MNRVVLYSLPGCSKCLSLKYELEQVGIEYREVSETHQVLEHLAVLNISSVPVLEVDGRYMLYDEAIEFINQYGY